jgi:hypothetical protein
MPFVTKDTDRDKVFGCDRPALTPKGEAATRAREVRLAAALRDNLRRRRADLAGRSGAATPASATDRSPKKDGEP